MQVEMLIVVGNKIREQNVAKRSSTRNFVLNKQLGFILYKQRCQRYPLPLCFGFYKCRHPPSLTLDYIFGLKCLGRFLTSLQILLEIKLQFHFVPKIQFCLVALLLYLVIRKNYNEFHLGQRGHAPFFFPSLIQLQCGNITTPG